MTAQGSKQKRNFIRMADLVCAMEISNGARARGGIVANPHGGLQYQIAACGFAFAIPRPCEAAGGGEIKERG